MLHGYRSRHDVCCNKCLHTRCYSCSDHAREILAAHERKNHGGESHAWKQERFHAAVDWYCRVCLRRFIEKARQISLDRYIGKTTLPSNGHANDAQGRSARTKFVQMFAELQVTYCEMEKRVSLNDRPIMMNCHVLYVGREIRHAVCWKMLFWNKENADVWNYQNIKTRLLKQEKNL